MRKRASPCWGAAQKSGSCATGASHCGMQRSTRGRKADRRRRRWCDGRVRRLRPAEFLHGQTRMPDLGHVADLVAVEVHDIDVVGLGALTSWRTRATIAGVCRIEHAIGSDVPPLLVRSERFELVATIRHEGE